MIAAPSLGNGPETNPADCLAYEGLAERPPEFAQLSRVGALVKPHRSFQTTGFSSPNLAFRLFIHNYEPLSNDRTAFNTTGLLFVFLLKLRLSKLHTYESLIKDHPNLKPLAVQF